MKRPLLSAQAWLIVVLTLVALSLSGLAQSAAPADAEVIFAIIGDTGTAEEGQFEIGKRLNECQEKFKYDFVIMLGDNIYDDFSPKGYKERFEEPYKALLEKGVKFHAVLGNHDVEKGNGDHQLKYEPMGLSGRRYYSYVKGDNLIEFFALDSNNMDSKQVKWLEEKLKASTARWKIAYYHHPLYSSSKKHGSDKRLRKKLEPLFEKYKIDVAFSGHDHVYERIRPQKGVQYFVAGSGGAFREGDLNDDSDYTAFGYDKSRAFVMAYVTRAQFRIEAITDKGEIVDTFAIAKAAAATATN